MQADRACEETLAGTEITDLERGRGGSAFGRREGRGGGEEGECVMDVWDGEGGGLS